MRNPFKLLRDRSASAAVEMALVTPLLLTLLLGSVEMGNFFLTEHILTKQVRDGARYASRQALSQSYSCPTTVFADPNATNNIIAVTKNGSLSGTSLGRLDSSYWARTCSGDTQPVKVTISCVDKTSIDTTSSGQTGIYTGLNGTQIPVATVSARLKYRSVLATLGWNAADRCIEASSNGAVQGI